jgi:TP901 family phage tail tape measure protein
MSGDTKHLGIILELDASGVVTGAHSADQALDKTKKKAKAAGKDVGDATQQTAGLMQQVAAGTAAVGGAKLTSAGDRVIGFFKTTADEAGKLENGLQQVKMVMGLIGKGAQNQKLVGEFKQVRAEILKIGRDTEWSTSQAASGFYMLKSAGIKTYDSKQLMKYTMALASASQGQIDLGTSAKVTGLLYNKFGLSVDETKKAINGLVKLTGETDVQFRDLRIMLSSLSAAPAKFKRTKWSEMFAFAGILKTMGLSAAQSTQYIQGFTRTVDKVLATMSGMVKKGKWKKDLYKKWGLTKEDFVTAKGEYKTLQEIMQSVNKRMVGLDTTTRNMRLRLIFGNDMVTSTFNLVNKYMETQKMGVTELSNRMKGAGDLAIEGQKQFLKTYQGQMQVFKGSMELMKASIGMAMMPVLMPFTKWLTKMVNKFVEWGKEHPFLFKAIVGLAIALGILFKVSGMVLSTMSMMSMIMMGMGPAAGSGATGMTLLKISLWGVAKAAWAAMVPLAKFILIGAAIAAALYGVYWVIKNWDKVWPVLKKVGYYLLWFIAPVPMLIWKYWKQIKGAFFVAINWIWKFVKKYWPYVIFALLGPLGWVGALIYRYWDNIKTAFWAAWDWMKDLGQRYISFWKKVFWAVVDILLFVPRKIWEGLQTAYNTVKDWLNTTIADFKASGKAIVMGIVDGIKSAAMVPVNLIRGIVKKIRDHLPFSPAKEGPLMTLEKGGEGIMAQLASGMQRAHLKPVLQAQYTLGAMRSEMSPEGSTFGGGAVGVGAESVNLHVKPALLGPTNRRRDDEGGNVTVLIPKMEFHATRMTSHEAEVFSAQVMRAVARKLQEYKDRNGAT